MNQNHKTMKTIPFLSTLLLALFIFTSFKILENRNVDTSELLDKNFKHIVRFNKDISEKEIAEIENYLHKYDSSIQLIHSRNEKNEIISFEIIADRFSCKSSVFGAGIIMVDEKNHCQCSVGKINY